MVSLSGLDCPGQSRADRGQQKSSEGCCLLGWTEDRGEFVSPLLPLQSAVHFLLRISFYFRRAGDTVSVSPTLFPQPHSRERRIKLWLKQGESSYLVPLHPELTVFQTWEANRCQQAVLLCGQLQFHLKKRASHLTGLFTYCSWCEHNTSSRKHR